MDTALFFSGGKDSMACLLLSRSRLHEIHVIFSNTGMFLPEQMEMVEVGKSMCPNFHEIHADRTAQNERYGLPSEIVPIDCTDFGMKFTGLRNPKVQSYLQCCWTNLSEPCINRAKELGCTKVIRGQRNEEDHKGPVRNGQVVEGITFLHPIEDWSTQQVLDYLRVEMGELPEQYAYDHTSLDCSDCTAYLSHSSERVHLMRRKHPERYSEYMKRLRALHGAVQEPAQRIERLLRIDEARA